VGVRVRGPAVFAGFRALASNGLDLPVLNVFCMFGKMGGKRVAVQSSADAGVEAIMKDGVRGLPDVSALASLEGKKLTVMAWHYHDDDVAGPEAAVTLTVTGLPLASGEARPLRITRATATLRGVEGTLAHRPRREAIRRARSRGPAPPNWRGRPRCASTGVEPRCPRLPPGRLPVVLEW
jgi:hypothetical protein